MNVETKFNFDKELFFLDDVTGKIKRGVPYKIQAEFEPTESKTYYFLKSDDNVKVVTEDKLFTARQELIDSL